MIEAFKTYYEDTYLLPTTEFIDLLLLFMKENKDFCFFENFFNCLIYSALV